MCESVVCNSSARLESETLTTVASICDTNAPSTATDEILQSCGLGGAGSRCSSAADTIRFSGQIAAVETAEVAGGEQADQKKTQPQRCHVGGGAQAEVADTADQGVSDGEIEHAPHDVDGRRGKPLPGWPGERALKGTPHDPADEVGDCVAKKHPAEKI